jgi:signal-transduction protein with cAMP-binding, CBS, and nucleotidyltransferase domain
MHPLIAEEIGRQRLAEMLREGERQRRLRRSRRSRYHGAAPPWHRARPGLFAWFAPRTRREAVRALEEAPLFRGLAPKDLAFLARKADPITFTEGRVLAQEQAPRPELFVITCGAAEASYQGKQTAILTAGDHFGEHTVLGGDPQVATITALSDGEGFVLGRRDFWAVLDAIPAVSYRLLSHMSEELREAQQVAGPVTARKIQLDRREPASAAS